MADEIPNGVVKQEPSFISKYGLIFGAVIVFLIIAYILSSMQWHLVDEPFFGGIFNTTFWGVQVYLFLVPVAVLAYFCSYAWWVHFQWNMMRPFHGLYNAMVAQSGVNFVTDLNLNFVLMSEAASKLIFDKERYNSLVGDTSSWFTKARQKIRPVDQAVHIAAYLQGSWDSKPMTNIGQIPAGILLDAYGWLKLVSPPRDAIRKAFDIWNDVHMDDQVHSFTKAWEYMAKGTVPTPDGVKLYVTIPWVRVDNAYPKKKYESSGFGFVMQIARNIANGTYTKGMSLTTVGMFIFVACIIFSILMFVMKFYTHAPVK